MSTVQVSPALLRGFNTTAFTKADVTVATAWTTANSPITIFTVTGTVLIRCYAVVTTAITSTSNTGTLALGVTGTTGLYMPATTANGSTNFILNSVWVDNAPTTKSKVLVAPNNMSLPILATADNVILTIATNNMTAGGMTIYADWIPVTSGASVV